MRWSPLLLVLASSAAAAPPAVQAVGAAQTTCPDGAALAARLPDAPPGAAFRVTFARTVAGRRALVERLDGPGRRTLHSTAEGCGPLAEAVALVMSLAVDPLAARPPAPPAPPPAAPPSVAASAPPPSPLHRSPGWELRLAAGAAGGSTPLAPAAALSVVRQGPSWTFGGGLRGQLPAQDALGQGTEVAVTAVAAEAMGCWRASSRWALCGVGVAGVVRAEGAGFARNAVVDGPWLAVGGRAQAALWRGAGWTLALLAEGLAVPTALELTFADRLVWASEPWHAQGGLELAWRFW